VLRRIALVAVGGLVIAGGFQLSAARVRKHPAHKKPPAHKKASAHHHLIWHDEFNGAAGTPPNPAKWVLATGGGPNGELEYYTASPANASLDGRGDLAILALQQTTSLGGQQWQYTSARLETLGLFQFRYGRLEARIRIPAGMGLWPAFWMLGNNYPAVGWPTAGELDAMEMQGFAPKVLVATLHGPATWSATGFQINRFYHSVTPLNQGFHVYTLDWGPGKLVWSIDGHAYGTITRRALNPGEQWVFNRPYYILLNIAVGGYWPGVPNASTHFPATMLVDWVRVYS
jgi:beta-glucanase (GH16 family)